MKKFSFKKGASQIDYKTSFKFGEVYYEYFYEKFTNLFRELDL